MTDVPEHPADGEPTLEQWRQELQSILQKAFDGVVFPWPPSQEILDDYARKVAEAHYPELAGREYGVDWKASGRIDVNGLFTAVVTVRVAPPRDFITVSLVRAP